MEQPEMEYPSAAERMRKEMDEVNVPNEFVLAFLDLVDCSSPLHTTYKNLYLGAHDHLTLYTLLEKGLQHGRLDFAHATPKGSGGTAGETCVMA